MCSRILATSVLVLVLALSGCDILPAVAPPSATPTPAGPTGWISFDSKRDGAWGIYAVRADGRGNPVLITASAAGDYWSTWSPDGRQIAFTSYRESLIERGSAIWIINADNSGLRRLTGVKSNDSIPAWSPDGEQIAFVSEDLGDDWSIYTISAGGLDRTRLTSDPGVETYPAWRPDGQAILFQSDRSGGLQIYALQLSDKKVTQLTDMAENSHASWSPNGQKIAFASSRDGNADIYLMDADGGNQVPLTTDEANDQYPAWSPDGRYIAFTSDRSGNRDIYVMKADGSQVTQITDDPGDDYPPRWSPVALDSFGGPETVISDEPWFGEPQCQRDTDGDGTPDTPTTTFLTTDEIGYVVFLFGNMRDGMPWGTSWDGEALLGHGASLGYWNYGPAGVQVVPHPIISAGKFRVGISLPDSEISHGLECAVVSAAAPPAQSGADTARAAALPEVTATDAKPQWPPAGAATLPAATATAAKPQWPPAGAATWPAPAAGAASPTSTLGLALASGSPVPPTATGTLPSSGNLALNRLTSSSSSESWRPASRAVDGDTASDWGSGAFPPQWIQIDLGAEARVSEIRLLATQNPAGYTEHSILVGASPGDLVEVHRFQQETRSGQWLFFSPEAPLEGVRFVRVLTTRSPSWVGWVEIRVLGER